MSDANESKPLKSALELAMERLRQKDADAGVESRPLTERQKAAISEIRNYYEAKLAEIDVLHRSKLRSLFDPAARDAAEQEFRRERERLVKDRESKIQKARAIDA